MHDFAAAFATALVLIVELDHDLVAIVCLSLVVSLAAVSLAAVCGLPLGAAVAVCRFPGRGLVGALLNAMMGLPPVVVGLALYVLLSRAGSLGELGLLYTPTAMILAQCVLVAPIIAALTRQTIADLYEEYDEQLRSLDVGPCRTIGTLLWDGRFRLLTAVLAGLGRASAEVGAVLIVGGNINHVTRVMTTTIALETSKGNLDTGGEFSWSTLVNAYAASAAKAERRVVARGVPSNHAATRTRLSAVAVRTCWRWVLPWPM